METVITFTPHQLIGLVGAICGGIIAVSGAVGVIVTFVKKIKTPNQLQNLRLDAIEIKLKQHDQYFTNDKLRFENLEESNRVTQRALLALLTHGIDGNEIETLKDAKTELTNFLIKR